MAKAPKRANWGSTAGFLLAAVGSAIGLGNIWRFSYMAFEHGGGAFLVPYAVALVLAGLPLMILEYALGHMEKASSPLAFARVSAKWEWVGWWMPIVAFFGIMLYYSVVIGWCVNYLFYSGTLAWGEDAQGFFFGRFLQLTESPLEPGGIRLPIAGATFAVWIACWLICYRQVNHGIEIACKVFMPLLFLLTLVLVVWTLRLEGAMEAVRSIYLKPDWHKINFLTNPAAAKVWIAAFGQIFFTLSLGFGIMITYASYLPRRTDILGNAFLTAFTNCIFSFVAGFAVFGIVGFMAATKGMPFDEVIKGGPQLAFVVYPEAIRQLPFGQNVFGVLFFLVLVMAGLSSGISLVEAFACAVTDKFRWKRTNVVTVICVLGFLGSVLFTTRGGLLMLDIVDHYVTNFGLVLGGLLECVLVGWVLKAHMVRKHVNESGGLRLHVCWDICIRYITPLILALVLGKAVFEEFREAYGGYDLQALLLLGVLWVVATLAGAVVFATRPWSPDRRLREHEPEEDRLLT